MHRKNNKNNEEQIITGHPIDGAMGSSGGGRVRKLSVVCLHKKAIVARCILVTILQCRTHKSRLSAIYIVSAVGTSLISIKMGKLMIHLTSKLWRTHFTIFFPFMHKQMSLKPLDVIFRIFIPITNKESHCYTTSDLCSRGFSVLLGDWSSCLPDTEDKRAAHNATGRIQLRMSHNPPTRRLKTCREDTDLTNKKILFSNRALLIIL